MLKTLPLLLLAACAADPIDQTETGDDDTSSVESNLIGSENMVEYNVNGNTLTRVNGATWSDEWTQAVPIDIGGKQLVFLYSRGGGTAKVVQINTDGSWSILSTISGVQTGWDAVVATQVGDPLVNLAFYRRSDNLLKTAKVTATGAFSVVATGSLPPPPPGNGWSSVVSGKLFHGVTGDLVVYEKTSGEARLFTLNIATHLYDQQARYTLQTVWDKLAAGDFDGGTDGNDDLAFYSEGTGDLKTVKINSDFTLGTATLVMPSPGTSAGARLVAADFSGNSQSDVLLYTSPATGNGRLRIYQGATFTKTTDVTVNSGWTQLVPRNYGQAHPGILFYSNHGTVN